MRRLCSDIKHYRAALKIAVVKTECVDQRSLRRVNQFHVYTLRLCHLDHPVRNLALERGEQHLDLARLGHAHRVMIPRGLLQRERNVLLRLKLNQLRNLCLVDRRQADRLGQYLKTRSRHQASRGCEAGLIPQFLRGLLHRLGTRPLTGPLEPHWLYPKTNQAHAALSCGLELGGTQCAGAHIDC